MLLSSFNFLLTSSTAFGRQCKNLISEVKLGLLIENLRLLELILALYLRQIVLVKM